MNIAVWNGLVWNAALVVGIPTKFIVLLRSQSGLVDPLVSRITVRPGAVDSVTSRVMADPMTGRFRVDSQRTQIRDI